MNIFAILSEIIETGQWKYSDNLTIVVGNDFTFELKKENDYLHLKLNNREVKIITRPIKLKLFVDGIKFYKDRYVIEIPSFPDQTGYYNA